jgi:hypothetical protein
MGLKITDVSAGVVLLTIDDSGLICLGSGVPVTQLSINGIGVVDSQGNITNLRAPGSSMSPTSGTVTVLPGGSAAVATLPGEVPSVQVDAFWPSIRTQHILVPLNHCVTTNIYNSASHRARPLTGQFRVFNTTAPSDDGQCPTGIPDEISYRWM